MDQPDRERVKQLYEQGRFVDAYRASTTVWDHPERVDTADAGDLVLAGRLALRLGGWKVSRWLFRTALARAPHDPQVRYFARSATRSNCGLLDELRLIDREPDLPDADPHVRASWLGHNAMVLARARDFDRAMELSDRARELSAEAAWVSACRSTVLILADRWQEALQEAEAAWRDAPGMPAAAFALGATLARCGRLAEAAERLSQNAEHGQSFEVLLTALRYCCAHAERQHLEGTREWQETAERLAALLPAAAPLADRSVQCIFEAVHSDLALMTGDHRALLEREMDHPSLGFFRVVQDHVRAHAGGRRTLLACKGALQKHNTCLPSSVATVLSAWGEEIDVDALADELTYGGTPVWRIDDWLTRHGFDVQHAVYSEAGARGLIEAGIPFVLLFMGEGHAHAVAAFGLDEAAGTLILYDPSGLRWRHVLLDRLADYEKPIGPQVMAVVPERCRDLVRGLLPEDDVAVLAARHAFDRTYEQEGTTSSAAVVESLVSDYPDHPCTAWLAARLDAMAGRLASAIERQEELVSAYPQNLVFRQDLLASYHRTGNTARMRDAMQEVVERHRMPGVEAHQDWIYPPAIYVARYADLLSLSAEHSERALRILERTLVQAPGCGELYHVLGDVLSRASRREDSVLPYRVASNLDEEDDHYARAVSDAYRLTGREEDGLAFLRSRAGRLSGMDRGLSAWSAYVDALEDYGHPLRASQALEEALASKANPEVLWSYACGFWGRRGRWDEAGHLLEQLSGTPRKLEYERAAALHHHARGAWRAAWPHAERWLSDAPHHLGARQFYLHLLSMKEGRSAALHLARDWMAQQPGHDGVELLVLEQLDRQGHHHEVFDLLQRRIQRNGEDAWAWRELGHRHAGRLEVLPEEDEDRGRLEARLALAIQGCERTCPESPATLGLRARNAELRGQVPLAIVLYQDALYADPSYEYAYRRIADLLPQVEEGERDGILDTLEATLLRSVGPLRIARQLVPRLARYRGFEHALARIQRWRERRGGDAELVMAHAELLQEHGAGRPDAEQAVAVLREGIRSFPAHHELRQALAHALSALVMEEEAIRTLRDIVGNVPAHNRARMALADILEHQGHDEETGAILKQAIEIDPLDLRARTRYARYLWIHELPLEAVEVLYEGAAHMPEDAALRESLIHRLLDLGRSEDAVAVARQGVECQPREAYGWYLLGFALARSPEHTAAREVEDALVRALRLNALLFEAADELAVFHVAGKRFAQARQVIESIVARLDDPSSARGRLAWIAREEGRREEARAALLGVLGEAPWYRWGWHTLMRWLVEDEAWEQVKTALGSWPDGLRDAVSLRAQRLEVLERAGERKEQLDREWHALLTDFPQNVEIAMRRFDRLWDERRYREAEALLASAERFHGGNRYLLARKVFTLSREGKREPALDTAMQIWLQPSSAEWPDEAAWDAIARQGWGRRARQRIVAALEDDYRVSPAVFEKTARQAAGLRPEASPRERGALTCALAARPAIRRVLRLLRLLDGRSWDATRHRAVLMRTLSSMGYCRLVLRLWNRNREQWNAQTPVWEQVGYAALKVSRSRARALLADWGSRPGVEMFTVANYTHALRGAAKEGSRHDRLEDIVGASRHALDQVADDWTVRYLACVYCEGLLRLGRYQEFVEGMGTYWKHIDPSRDHRRLYMPDSYLGTPEVLQRFHQLLGRSEDAPDLEALDRAVVALVTRHRLPDWVLETWYDCRRLDEATAPSKWTRLKWRWSRFIG